MVTTGQKMRQKRRKKNGTGSDGCLLRDERHVLAAADELDDE